jgi:release factor glutamine methyltransferase
MQIADALNGARALGVDRLDAQLLLAHLMGQPRSWLLAHDDVLLDATQIQTLQRQLARRATGEPLAYVLGEAEFRRLRLRVSSAVLVPRPETEVLVEWALEHLPADAATDVLDLGTGSGAIALALQQARPDARVCASDASAEALAVARGNGQRLGLNIEWLDGDWWAPLAGRRFGLVVSNPPYVAGNDEHLDALAHEPRMALTPEGDGLDALRRIIAGAPTHLLPGAWLLLEHGHDQAPAVQGLLSEAGLLQPQTRADLAGLSRCTGARWPGAK